MRVATPTASGASCVLVLGLQRAWAQPRRTDSSTCSATSSQYVCVVYCQQRASNTPPPPFAYSPLLLLSTPSSLHPPSNRQLGENNLKGTILPSFGSMSKLTHL
jgi:hypothetical protein